jgi:cold shock protein
LSRACWLLVMACVLAVAGCGGDADQSGGAATEAVTAAESGSPATPGAEIPPAAESSPETETSTEAEASTETEATAGTETGTVKWFTAEKGYGMIAPDGGGADVYVHFSAIAGGEASLAEGTRVEFEVEEGANGREARNVRSITPLTE